MATKQAIAECKTKNKPTNLSGRHSLVLGLRAKASGPSVTDLALSYDHAINNSLASILGNTQLLLHATPHGNADCTRKLMQIETEAKKIQGALSKLASLIELLADGSNPNSEQSK